MRALLVVVILGAACLVSANTSSAADHGQVPASMLSQMGLGGMQPMSDLQGQAIRGMGRRGGATIQANVVVQIAHSGNAGNGGAGGTATGVGNGNNGTDGFTSFVVPVGGSSANGGNGGSVNGTTFNNATAAFIQVNVGRVRFGGFGPN